MNRMRFPVVAALLATLAGALTQAALIDIGENYFVPEVKTPADYATTIYIDPDAPTNGSGTVQDPKNSIVGINYVSNTAYLIKAGTFTSGELGSPPPDIYIGRYGSGPNPVIQSHDKILHATSGFTLVGVNLEKFGSGSFDAVFSLDGNAANVTFADCRIRGLDDGNGNPFNLLKGSAEGLVFYRCEFSHSRDDGFFLGENADIAFVSNYFHHHNTRGGTGDAVQAQGTSHDRFYFANNYVDRRHTRAKYGLLINPTSTTHGVVCEWNTLFAPRAGNGGAGLRWFAGLENTCHKNLIITTTGMSGIETAAEHALQPFPYGLRDNHAFGSGPLFYNHFVGDSSNLLFPDEAAYLAYLSANGIEAYGSDLQIPPDVTPPTTPVNLSGYPILNTIYLDWDDSTDEGCVDFYEIYRDGVLVATTIDSAFIEAGLTKFTPFSYTVKAVDVDGNESALSAPLVVSTDNDVDLIAPTIPGGIVIEAIRPTAIDLSWDPSSDNVAVTNYRIYLDGANPMDVGSVNSATVLNLTPSTFYQLALAAADGAGNESASSNLLPVTTLPPDVQPPTVPTGLTAGTSANTVILDWVESADDIGVAGYDIFRDGTLWATVEAPPFSDFAAEPATSYTYNVSAFDDANNTSAPSAPLIVATDIPLPLPPFTYTDLGAVGVAGSMTAIDGTLEIHASGWDIYWGADGCGFASVPLAGDFDVRVFVEDVEYLNYFSKGGIMARATLASESRNATIAMYPGGGAMFSNRREDGAGTTTDKDETVELPCWVRLVREGDTFTGYTSIDGVDWNAIQSANIAMGPTAFVGLAATSHNNGVLGTSTFRFYSAGGEVPLDTEPPTPPTGLVGTSTTSTATLNWNASTDNVGVASYEIRRDGVLLTSLPETSFTDSGLLDDTTYNYTVRAYDGAGNASSDASLAITTDPDLSPPPTTLTYTDIGTVGIAGNAVGNGDSIQLTASGADIWGGSDGCGFAYTEVSGDFDATAYVVTIPNANAFAKGGIMARTSLQSNAAMAMMALYPGGGSMFIRRTWSGGSASSTKNLAASIPFWVRLVRIGNTFYGYDSADGGNWNLVSQTSLPAGESVFVGLAQTSHDNSSSVTSTFQSFSFTGESTPDTTPPTVPTGLVATAGETTVDLGWNAATDDVAVSGYRIDRDGSEIATTAGTTFADSGLAAGTAYTYAVRAFDAAGNLSASASVNVTTAPAPDTTPPTIPTGLVATAGETTVDLGWIAATDNVAVSGYRIDRDGSEIAMTAGTTFADSGLAAGTAYTYAVRAFDAAGNLSASASVNVTTDSPPPVSDLTHAEIGGPNPAGSLVTNGNTLTLSAAGGDIWNNSDQCGFAYRTVTGDVDLIVRVVSVENTSAFAKAGLMIRQDFRSNSPFAMMAFYPGGGTMFLRRSFDWANCSSTKHLGVSAPIWLRLVRTGNTLSGYDSSDGVTWNLVSSESTTLPATVQVGLAVTSHANGVLNTSIFEDFSIVEE